MAIYKRTCRECGAVFDGGPRAWYCPLCRVERRRTASRLGKRREARGLTRKIGSIDKCEICGGEYKVKSARQRYCPDCACAAWAEADREQSLAYYEDHKDEINPKRKAQRKKDTETRICIVCGQPFQSVYPRQKTCDEECARKHKNNLWREWYHRKAASRSRIGETEDSTRTIWKGDDVLRMLNMHILGRTDEDIAMELGQDAEAVTEKRLSAMGKGYTHDAPVVSKSRDGLGMIAWGKVEHLLGVIPDRTIAGLLGCSRRSVERQREKYNIPPALKAKIITVDWERWDGLLGTMSDRSMAEKIGCPHVQVYRRRNQLGIAPYSGPRERTAKFDWSRYDHLLGTMSDAAAARIIGCSPGEARRRRVSLGIGPCVRTRP